MVMKKETNKRIIKVSHRTKEKKIEEYLRAYMITNYFICFSIEQIKMFLRYNEVMNKNKNQ